MDTQPQCEMGERELGEKVLGLLKPCFCLGFSMTSPWW